MEAVVNLLSHKWIHLTDGAILIFATAIIAVPEARPIIVLCVVLAALAFAVLDNPFQAVMVVWTRVMSVRQGIKDMNFLTFLAVMVLPWALLSVFFGANDMM